jgi:hypothetical protein
MNKFRVGKFSTLKRSVNLVSTIASNFATDTGLLLVERDSTTFTTLGVLVSCNGCTRGHKTK